MDRTTSNYKPSASDVALPGGPQTQEGLDRIKISQLYAALAVFLLGIIMKVAYSWWHARRLQKFKKNEVRMQQEMLDAGTDMRSLWPASEDSGIELSDLSTSGQGIEEAKGLDGGGRDGALALRRWTWGLRGSMEDYDTLEDVITSEEMDAMETGRAGIEHLRRRQVQRQAELSGGPLRYYTA